MEEGMIKWVVIVGVLVAIFGLYCILRIFLFLMSRIFPAPAKHMKRKEEGEGNAKQNRAKPQDRKGG